MVVVQGQSQAITTGDHADHQLVPYLHEPDRASHRGQETVATQTGLQQTGHDLQLALAAAEGQGRAPGSHPTVIRDQILRRGQVSGRAHPAKMIVRNCIYSQ